VAVPLIGAGGVGSAEDAVQYLLAGASLVQIGTASFADPRAAERVLTDMERWCAARNVGSITGIVGRGLTV